MAFRHQPGKGTLFVNEKYVPDDPNCRLPMWRGKITTPSGEELQVALWPRSKDGKDTFAVAITPPYQGSGQGSRQEATADTGPFG
jgi:hypothetical protein